METAVFYVILVLLLANIGVNIVILVNDKNDKKDKKDHSKPSPTPTSYPVMPTYRPRPSTPMPTGNTPIPSNMSTPTPSGNYMKTYKGRI